MLAEAPTVPVIPILSLQATVILIQIPHPLNEDIGFFDIFVRLSQALCGATDVAAYYI